MLCSLPVEHSEWVREGETLILGCSFHFQSQSNKKEIQPSFVSKKKHKLIKEKSDLLHVYFM